MPKDFSSEQAVTRKKSRVKGEIRVMYRFGSTEKLFH